MGRDIHVYAERFNPTSGEWESLDKWVMEEEDGGQYAHWYTSTPFYEGGRDYGLFKMLGLLFPSKGMPGAVSPELARIIDNTDWHSYNYVTLEELKAVNIKSKQLEVEGYISLLDYLECRSDIGMLRDCYIARNKIAENTYIDESEVDKFINSIVFNGVPAPKQVIENFLAFGKAHDTFFGYFQGVNDLDRNSEYQFFKWLFYSVRVYIKQKLSIAESFPEFFVNALDKLAQCSNGDDRYVRLVYWFDN